MRYRPLLAASFVMIAALAALVPACRTAQPRNSRQAERIDRRATAGCAMCIFHMPGVCDCVLAVRIDGRDYLVRGSSIDEHGDAHAADGLCNSSREADVEGQVEGDWFVASRVILLPVK